MLAAHESPPPRLREAFKYWQKLSVQDVTDSHNTIDVASGTHDERLLVTDLSHEDNLRINAAFQSFLSCKELEFVQFRRCELIAFPGLFIYPSLIPAGLQFEMLDRLLHRDLCNPEYNTNIHLHYDMTEVQNGRSFFDIEPAHSVRPLEPAVHKAITMQRMLEKKLRWVTLGGQYDWTAKVYPDKTPPRFPQDVASLLRAIFPSVDPQAAILNLYSPGDTLSVHRDVSEECDRGLISVSMGCDALFLLGNTDGSMTATLRLKSGDTILMSGLARYAWHAVPKVLANTCLRELSHWPSKEAGVEYKHWAGWLNNKRVNLNVRQMK